MVKEMILAGLTEMKDSGKINEPVYALLLTRLDSMTATISDCGSVEETVKCELYGLGLEPGYPYYGDTMVALTREEALTVFEQQSAPVFAVCGDGTEFELERREDIARGDYCFAIEKGHTITFRPEMEMRL